MRHIESKLQQQCVAWFRYQYPSYTLFAIPNGGKRNATEAKIMKAEGVVAGVADLFLMHQRNEITYTGIKSHLTHCNGLFIEIKTEKGKQTESQKEFECAATFSNYKYVVCRSLDEFVLTVNNYLSIK